ncbi:DinB superfamily protein [Planctomycetes bacterium Poly30]|uniref:DinB superfamily protein n=1 Tax=Saltatorellus ferox TaxID=2528018 RepID=A0A518EPK2_9BACT|nr:DinB superfamily protein [Planctomycetes bacterium Poly30]
MIAEFIARQLEHRYRVLVRSLGHGLTEELAWKSMGGRPPIGWHASHVAEAMASAAEAIALGPGGAKLSPTMEACAARRGAAPAASALSTAPAQEATSYATTGLPVLVAEVNRLSFLVLGALKSLTDADLERPPLVEVHPAFRSTLISRMVFLEGHLFHVTYHLGAIGLLRAEWRLEA